MAAEEALDAACQALRKNDPRRTNLNLNEYGYGSLVDWKEKARKVAAALEENKVVEEMWLPKHLCADSAFQLSHFMRSSPSLRRLEMYGKDRTRKKSAERTRSSRLVLSLNRFPVAARWSS